MPTKSSNATRKTTRSRKAATEAVESNDPSDEKPVKKPRKRTPKKKPIRPMPHRKTLAMA